MTKWGYVRVSTARQDTSEQRRELEAHGVEPEHIEEDHGITGRTMERDGLTRLLGRMESGDTVLVTALDRAGRTMKGMLELVEELTERGITMRTTAGDVNTGTEMGRAVFHILSALAVMEANIKRERAQAGIRRAQASGQKIGGRKPVVSDLRITQAATRVRDGSSSVTDECHRLAMSRQGFYKRIKSLGLELRA
ncbi:recombinase family protein [Nesterenkonia sp. LB17]|uniref:recombinase family protein n=1 Tax=Nesterenkonia sp. LB17 TaxID=2901230 RepID=UPI001F4CB7B9|nr:recombinase family protein [Nesterenkonia sp. LB17]MCH8564727.1 recombinase family protein [Nesterenkonia sp. LB17]